MRKLVSFARDTQFLAVGSLMGLELSEEVLAGFRAGKIFWT
jgi:hypothetical protein